MPRRASRWSALPGLAEVPADARHTPYSPLGFRLAGGDPESLVTGSDGRVRVQDEGSQLAALALTRAEPVRPGERWLDLCAGPGGKTAVLAAEALTPGRLLEANEISPARAGLVRRARRGRSPRGAGLRDGRAGHGPQRARRLRPHPRRRAVHGPGSAPSPARGALAQVAGRRPSLTELQAELLTAAIVAVRPGGIVAYVTCSPHLAETAGVVAEVRRAFGGTVEELDARAVIAASRRPIPAFPSSPTAPLRAQLWPHRHNTDAMSISLLRRGLAVGQPAFAIGHSRMLMPIGSESNSALRATSAAGCVRASSRASRCDDRVRKALPRRGRASTASTRSPPRSPVRHSRRITRPSPGLGDVDDRLRDALVRLQQMHAHPFRERP